MSGICSRPSHSLTKLHVCDNRFLLSNRVQVKSRAWMKLQTCLVWEARGRSEEKEEVMRDHRKGKKERGKMSGSIVSADRLAYSYEQWSDTDVINRVDIWARAWSHDIVIYECRSPRKSKSLWIHDCSSKHHSIENTGKFLIINVKVISRKVRSAN